MPRVQKKDEDGGKGVNGLKERLSVKGSFCVTLGLCIESLNVKTAEVQFITHSPVGRSLKNTPYFAK